MSRELLMSFLLRLADALNRDDSRSRWLNIGLAVGLGLVANGLAIWIGRGMEFEPVSWLSPPPWLAAIIWLFTFLLLGASRWTLNSYTIIGVATARTMVTLLIVLGLLWPFYSLPVVDLRVTLFANAATLALAIAAAVLVGRRSIEAASLILPVIVWLAFTTLVVLSAIEGL